jgi:hypothetical protein
MSKIGEQVITPEVINNAMDYGEYRHMINELLEQNKTTGTNHSEQMVEYTRMNVHRMNRIDKQLELSDELVGQLKQVEEKWIWLVLTEAWCGDAAQNIPVIVKMANQNDNIDLRFILRDENLEIMDEYLTNGGRSIPKLICLDAEMLEEKGTWGPRPEEAQQKAMEWKEDPNISKKEWAEKLHKWYADNRASDIQDEFKGLVSDWK